MLTSEETFALIFQAKKGDDYAKEKLISFIVVQNAQLGFAFPRAEER